MCQELVYRFGQKPLTLLVPTSPCFLASVEAAGTVGNSCPSFPSVQRINFPIAWLDFAGWPEGRRKLRTWSVLKSIPHRYIWRWRSKSLSFTGSTPAHLPVRVLLTK